VVVAPVVPDVVIDQQDVSARARLDGRPPLTDDARGVSLVQRPDLGLAQRDVAPVALGRHQLPSGEASRLGRVALANAVDGLLEGDTLHRALPTLGALDGA